MINTTELSKRLKKNERNILGHEKALKSAVLIPLIYKKNEWHALFEVRAKHLNTQPGEICFPGGTVEAEDKNDQETAVRETCEELRISPEHVEMIGTLDIFVPSQHFIVYPHVGIIANTAIDSPDKGEVEEVFTVPLQWLIENKPALYNLDLDIKPQKNFPFHLIPNGKDYNWRKYQIPEYFYHYKDRVIWGLTARILHHFLNIIKAT